MKDKIIIIVGSLIIGIVLSFLYSHAVVSNPWEKFKEYDKSIDLRDNRAKVDLNLSKDLYFLKIKHIIQENQPKEVFINGVNIGSDIYRVKKRGIIETSYAYASKDVIRPGKNTIELYFPENHPPDVNIVIANYRRETGKDIYILFSGSVNLPTGGVPLKTTVMFAFLTALFLSSLAYYSARMLSLSLFRIFIYEICSLLLFIISLTCLWILPNFNDTYRIVISPSYFWTFGLISFLFIGGCIISVKVLHSCKAFKWVKAREFSDKCIIFFMALLVFCTFLLILHADPAAEAFANIGYLSLVTGVIVKFVKLVREERRAK
jgi:hypothetical protein